MVRGLHAQRAMKTIVLSFLVLVGAARAAHADGWWEACDSDDDGQTDCGGCDSDGNPDNGLQCKCSTSSDPVSVGVGLALAGFVSYRIGRKRRPR